MQKTDPRLNEAHTEEPREQRQEQPSPSSTLIPTPATGGRKKRVAVYAR